jgi:hypothetical protein
MKNALPAGCYGFPFGPENGSSGFLQNVSKFLHIIWRPNQRENFSWSLSWEPQIKHPKFVICLSIFKHTYFPELPVFQANLKDFFPSQ